MRGICAVILLAVVAPCAPAAGWARTVAGGFEVVSNAGDRPTRAISDRLLAAETVFRDAPAAPRSMPPVRVIVFGSEKDYRPFRLGPDVEGFFQSAPDRLWIAVNAASPEPPRVAVHEFVHALLSRSPVRLPAWLEEGLPELYSTMIVRDGTVRVGDPIASRVKALDKSKWLTAAELGLATGENTAVFYAESWALTHMLSLGASYRGGMPAFIQALADGTPAASAFRDAFGKSMDDALRDLRSYAFQATTIPAPPDPTTPAERSNRDREGAAQSRSLPPPAVSVAPVAEPESLAMRAELLLLLRREPEALALYGELTRRYPRSPEARSAAVVIATRRGDIVRARELLREAAESEGATPAAWFEYAMSLNDARAPDAEIDAALARVVQLSPDHAEAHLLLGIHAARAQRWDDAERELRKAASILPKEPKVWYELAWALKNAGRTAEAVEAAQKAVRLSTTKEDEDRARALLDTP